MKISKMVTAAMAVALVLSLTACAKNEQPNGNSGGKENSQSSSTPNISSVKDDASTSEPVKELDIWDVLPDIPVTDASAFKYRYDSELGGMIITDYLRESPKVHIPDTLEGEPVVGIDEIAEEKELTELIIPDSVTYIDDTVLNRDSFKGIYVSQGNLNYCSVDGILFNKDKTTIIRFPPQNGLTSYVIPDDVTTIYPDAFDGCKSLTSLTIPNSVTEIGECAFSRCTTLTSVTIPDSVTEIGNLAFFSCTSLTSIVIPGGVTKISYCTFAYCKNLTSVTIHDGVTTIDQCAFEDCTSLTSVTIPDSVNEIFDNGLFGTAFKGCESLTSVTYKGKTYDYEHIIDLYRTANGN